MIQDLIDATTFPLLEHLELLAINRYNSDRSPKLIDLPSLQSFIIRPSDWEDGDALLDFFACAALRRMHLGKAYFQSPAVFCRMVSRSSHALTTLSLQRVIFPEEKDIMADMFAALPNLEVLQLVHVQKLKCDRPDRLHLSPWNKDLSSQPMIDLSDGLTESTVKRLADGVFLPCLKEFYAVSLWDTPYRRVGFSHFLRSRTTDFRRRPGTWPLEKIRLSLKGGPRVLREEGLHLRAHGIDIVIIDQDAMSQRQEDRWIWCLADSFSL